MKYLLNIFNWLTNTPDLKDYNNNFKNTLIYSNIIFILVSFCIIKYKKNYNDHKIKYSLSLILIIVMGFISSKYHHCQCHGSSKDLKYWVKNDVICACLLTLICLIFYIKNINLEIVILILITIYLYTFPVDINKINIYILTHSLWHILIGVIFLLLIIYD